MANRPDSLANYNPPSTNDPAGSIKDQVYSGGSISETGSRAFARFVHDVLAMCYRLVRESGNSLNGSTDTQNTSQYYDGLDHKINRDAISISRRFARENALTNQFYGIDSPYGPDYSNNEFFYHAAFGNGAYAFLYTDKTSFVPKVLSVSLGGNNGILYDSSISGMGLSSSKTPMIFFSDGSNRFCVATSNNANSISAGVFAYSTNLSSWTNVVYESDGARPGGVCIGQIGSKMIIAAYDDPNNSIYYSDSQGSSGTWNRLSLTATTPNYKPVVCASGPNGMIWVDESQSIVRYSANGITWTTCSLGGNTISSPVAACRTDDAFIVMTDDYVWITDDGDYTTLRRYAKPRPYLFREVFAADGVIGICCASNNSSIYTTTPSELRNNNWYYRGTIPPGSSGATKSSVASGDSVVFIGNGDATGDSADIVATAIIHE